MSPLDTITLALSSGDSFAAWVEEITPGRFDIRGQFLTPTGALRGAELLLGTADADFADNIVLTETAGGRVATLWTETTEVDDPFWGLSFEREIRLRLADPALGARGGAPASVEQGVGIGVELAALESGGVATLSTSSVTNGFTSFRYFLTLRFHDTEGVQQGNATGWAAEQLNAFFSQADIVSMPGGGAVLAVVEVDQNGGSLALRVQVVAPDGTPLPGGGLVTLDTRARDGFTIPTLTVTELGGSALITYGTDRFRVGAAAGGFTGNADLLIGTDAGDQIATGGGDDRAYGNAGADTLQGGDGNDLLFGGTGADNMQGGAGNDRLDGGATHDAGDRLDGGIGTDTAHYDRYTGNLATGAQVIDLQFTGTGTGAATGDTLISVENVVSGRSRDQIRGDGRDNRLEGGINVDFLAGRGGNDALYGGAGNDILVGGIGGDLLDGGSNRDRASYLYAAVGLTADLAQPGSNTGEAAGDTYRSVEDIVGSKYSDSLRGDGGGNLLIGGGDSDQLFGRGGDDTLNGGAGGDYLVGQQGNDTLFGGNAVDVFVFDSGHDVIGDWAIGGFDDHVRINATLTGGSMDGGTIVSTWGHVVGGAIVLDFGGGNSLTVPGITNLTAFAEDVLSF